MTDKFQTPIIEIKGLNKTFTTKAGTVTALDNVELTINQGDIYGIIGLSGAGKSTLVRCINYLEKPTKGTVWVDGEDLSELSNAQLRRKRHTMGMIFQQFNLLMQKTAEKNIMFPMEITGVPKDEAKKRAKELLSLVELEDKKNAYPAQLSGGQKQRIAIARALATDPKVLLCDEATSALDPATTKSILNLLKDINKRLGITIVIITHQMSVIEEICSHVAIIDQSKISESGSVESIFKHPQSKIAKKLVSTGSDDEGFTAVKTKCYRIVFDGSTTYEPVISDMILHCKTPVNILKADIKKIEDKMLGHLLIEIPKNVQQAEVIKNYLQTRDLAVEEVEEYVG